MILLLVMLLVGVAPAPAEPAAAVAPAPLVLEQGEFDPGAWDRILAAHVRHGVLDYAAITPDEIDALDAFLGAAGDYKITSVFGKEPRAAFVINVYNAWAARQILAHPTAMSLTDIPGFFDARTIRIAGEERTLNDIEALLARVLPERPLAVFCLSPGGAGYPLIPARAFTGSTVVELTRDCYREYIHRPQFGMDEETREVSLPASILRHREWFEGTERGLLGVIGAELPVSTVIALNSAAPKVRYLEPDPVIQGRVGPESETGDARLPRPLKEPMNPYALADAHLNPAGAARWRTGHPWVYRAGIDSVEEDTGREALARVRDPRGRVLGTALLSRESQITLRRLGEGDREPDAGFFRDRIAAALAYRETVLPGRDAVRLVHGESDGLPGLVADRYGDHLVLQLLAWGADALRDEWVRLFTEVLDPASILARNDPAVRGLEGLPRVVEVLHGSPPDEAQYHEGELRFTADLRSGQKTGAFLDQVENHLRVGELARGRVLDAFTYAGGFGLAAAGRAEHVTLVDSSTEALNRARRHAELNGIGNVTFTEANAFDLLRQAGRDGESFDLVVLDPPAFAKNKRELDGALRGYKEINLRAMKLLRPGGILVTCSCSYHLSDAMMDEVLARAAADAHRGFRVRERRAQTPDHPVRVGFAESSYLKCRVLELTE